MHVLGIVGASDSERSTLVERLASRLSSSCRVATIKRLSHLPVLDIDGTDPHRHRATGANVTIGLTDGNGWFAAGDDLSLPEAIDRLARSNDVCLVDGFERTDIPAVVIGDVDHDGPTIATAPDVDGIDLETVVERLFAIEPYVTLESLIEVVKRSPHAERAGAIATFTGRVRAKDADDDQPTRHLEFEYYDGVADERLERIKTELEARDGVYEVAMHHRTGTIEYGEDIVFVVVLAAHRAEAFETVQDGINRLKSEVPIFKKEVTVEDEFWVHDRA